MIVKYENGNIWGYIDNLECVVNQELHAAEMMLEYRNMIEAGERPEHTPRHEAKCNDQEYEKVLAHNDLFMAVSEMISETFPEYSYTTMPLILDESLPDACGSIGEMPHALVICNLKDNKEFDKVMIITNQKLYLLNDNGKTIERIN